MSREARRQSRWPSFEVAAVWGRERGDVFLGFDPGFNQAIVALGVMVAITVSIACLYVFAQVTHAMWIEAPAGLTLKPAMAAQLHLQHHAETLLAMLMGGLIGMLSAFAVAETKPRDLAITMTVAPIPMLATMALSIELVHERALGIAVMGIVMGIGVWMPKLAGVIGARAFFLGQLLFVGYMFGFLSNGAVKENQLGWIAVILWFAALVNFLLKLLIFVPLSKGSLKRTMRAFFARARGVIGAAADLYTAGSPRARARARRRLRRRLLRLNEGALIIDGLLGNHSEIAHETHERLFDIELTVHSIGRLAHALSQADLPDDLRRAIGDSLARAREARNGFADEHVAALVRVSTGRPTGLSPLEAGRVTRIADALLTGPGFWTSGGVGLRLATPTRPRYRSNRRSRWRSATSRAPVSSVEPRRSRRVVGGRGSGSIRSPRRASASPSRSPLRAPSGRSCPSVASTGR